MDQKSGRRSNHRAREFNVRKREEEKKHRVGVAALCSIAEVQKNDQN